MTIKIKITTFFLLLGCVFGCEQASNPVFHPDDALCQGDGRWEYGKRAMGPIDDEYAPFISGSPPGICLLGVDEKEHIVNSTINKALGTPQTKIALFTMGPPGCGKSTAIDLALGELGYTKNQFVLVDPDDARAHIEAFKKMTHIPSTVCKGKYRAYADATPWCLSQGREVSAALLERAFSEERSLIYDSSCVNTDYCLRQMSNAKDLGYSVYLVAVFAQKDTCNARALSRAFQSGRYASPDYIDDVYEKIKNNQAFKNFSAIALDSFIYDSDIAKKIRKIYQKTKNLCDTSENACVYFQP